MAEAERIYYPFAPEGRWLSGHQGYYGVQATGAATLDDPDDTAWHFGLDPNQGFPRGSLNRYELDIPKGSTLIGAQVSYLNVANATQIPPSTANWSAISLVEPGVWQNEFGFSSVNYPDPDDLPWLAQHFGAHVTAMVMPTNHFNGLQMFVSQGGGYTTNVAQILDSNYLPFLQAWVDSDDYNPLTLVGRTIGLNFRGALFGAICYANLEKPTSLTTGPSLKLKYEAPISRTLVAFPHIRSRVNGLFPARLGTRVQTNFGVTDRVEVSVLSGAGST
jgi:hypothetical protein